jgi:hypothetical protein
MNFEIVCAETQVIETIFDNFQRSSYGFGDIFQ